MNCSMDSPLRNKKTFIIWGAFLLMSVLFFISLFVGKYPLSIALLKAKDPLQWDVFWNLRWSRVLVGCLGGMAMGMAGFVYQMVFRNSLASPDVVGVSSGASAGAAMGILFLGSGYSIVFCSFVGAMLAVLLALGFAAMDRSGNKTTVVLSGIAVHALAQTVLMLLKRMADPEKELASIEYWIMGGLNGIKLGMLWVTIPVCVLCMLLLLLFHRQSLLLSMDETEAGMLGMKVAYVRMLLLLIATLAVASIVSITGIISFVGLLAPHFARRMTKSSQVGTLLLSGFVGGSLLLLADMLARSVAQTELPVSIFTSMLGVPFLLLLILRGRDLA